MGRDTAHHQESLMHRQRLYGAFLAIKETGYTLHWGALLGVPQGKALAPIALGYLIVALRALTRRYVVLEMLPR